MKDRWLQRDGVFPCARPRLSWFREAASAESEAGSDCGSSPVALWTSFCPARNQCAVEAVTGFQVAVRLRIRKFARPLGRGQRKSCRIRDGKQWFRSYIIAKESGVDCDLESWKADAGTQEATASIDYAISDKFVPNAPQLSGRKYHFVQPETPSAFSTQLAAFLNRSQFDRFRDGGAACSGAVLKLLAAAPKVRRVSEREPRPRTT